MKTKFNLLAAFAMAAIFLIPSATRAQDEEVVELPKAMIGSWKGDSDKTKELNKDNDEDFEGEDDLNEFLENISGMEMEFKADGAMKMTFRGRSMDAEWSSEQDGDDGKKFNVTMTMGGRDRLVTVEVKDDGLVVDNDSDPAIYLVKKTSGDTSEIAKKLVGQWAGDADATEAAAKEAGVDDAEIEQVKAQIASVSLSFTDANTYKMQMVGRDESDEGDWELETTDEEGVYKLSINSTANEGFAMVFNLKFISDDHASFQRDNQPAGHFKRNKD